VIEAPPHTHLICLHSLTNTLEFRYVSEVIYARVPDSVKGAADAYANQRGTTLTGAVVDLLERGLAAVADQRSIEQLEVNLARVTAEKAEIDAKLHGASAELAVLRAFSERAGVVVGKCPNTGCGRDITGYHLLAAGKCPACGQALTGLIAPASRASTLDQRELLLLLGALGAVLAFAYVAAQ
jgi:hypothetical protein